MRRRIGLGVLAVWGCLAVPGASWAGSEPGPFANVMASVLTRHPDEAAPACAGARDAFGFLGRLQLERVRPVLIEVVSEMPEDLRRDAVGCYAPRTHRLLVLEMARFMDRGRWFGVPTSETLYRSVVAHEVAHALVGCHLDGRQLVTSAHEYVAYVAMFATMDPATLEAVFAAMPGPGFTYDAEINDMRYTLDPMAFGVEAYRHWLRQPDGFGFLRQVIDGKVVPELLLSRSSLGQAPDSRLAGGAASPFSGAYR